MRSPSSNSSATRFSCQPGQCPWRCRTQHYLGSAEAPAPRECQDVPSMFAPRRATSRNVRRTAPRCNCASNVNTLLWCSARWCSHVRPEASLSPNMPARSVGRAAPSRVATCVRRCSSSLVLAPHAPKLPPAPSNPAVFRGASRKEMMFAIRGVSWGGFSHA